MDFLLCQPTLTPTHPSLTLPGKRYLNPLSNTLSNTPVFKIASTYCFSKPWIEDFQITGVCDASESFYTRNGGVLHSSGSSVIAADCIKADSSPLSLPLKGSTYQNTTSKGHIHIRTPLYCMAIGPASSVTVHSNVVQYSSTLEFAVTLQTLLQCTAPLLICTAF